MKRLFLSLAILMSISLTTNVVAQQREGRGRRNSAIEKELNLSDEQKKKMETERADFRKKMGDVQKQSDLTKEQKQAKVKELREQHAASVNKILTPEQQTKMKELREKRAKDRDERRSKADVKRKKQNDRQMAMRGDKMKRQMKDLNLSDDQKEKIKAINEDFRAKSKELAKEREEALNQVYTPEQQAMVKELRKDFGKNRHFAHKGKRGYGKLDQASIDKLKSLKENFVKEKSAIERSRIAPDVQQQKLTELRQNYKKERQEIIKSAKGVKENKPV
ncbi:hypothetical protein [Dysgonomonas sp. 511]|uniref:hypothetical protein n=1 Tax=Dysgonomonas sp. 511 TaxID=2302930 RepID=UPI0013D194F6|nr:hypothetical protein [Dysgonomonas sp. 511]NDV78498.1 hypothetical protein [Dysgonomonas sp. 511]